MPTPEQRIREFYGFAFPDDFFAFREFMAGLPRNALHDVCDMRPAFPFAVANGCAATDYPDHPAWEDRYYNDLPEFVTLFRGSIDGLHFGYFFDAPGELPPVVAHFYNSDTFQHDLDGDTIFEAVRYRLENGESSFHEMIEDDPDEAAHYRRRLKQTERLREKLSKHFGADRPETGEEYTDTYDAYGGRKTVADTWDDMGIVVPKGKYRKLKRDPFAAHPPQPTKAVIKPLVAQAKKQLAAGYPGAALKLGRDLWAWAGMFPVCYDLLDAAYAALGASRSAGCWPRPAPTARSATRAARDALSSDARTPSSGKINRTRSLPCGASPMPALTAGVLRRDPADVAPWAETCGQIRCLVEQKDGAAAEIHHVEIADAKLHYHARTDEFYYVIDGQGTMTLDGEEIELHKGVVVYIPRGVKHAARGSLTILTVCIPAGVMDDIHEVE